MHDIFGIHFVAYAYSCKPDEVIEVAVYHLTKSLPCLYVERFLHFCKILSITRTEKLRKRRDGTVKKY